MISSEAMKGYNDLLILAVLLRGDSYGYAISREIREGTRGAYQIKETTLYSAFDRLAKAGCLSSYEGSESHGKPRTYFHLTERGRAMYEEKKAEFRAVSRLLTEFLEGEGKP